MSRPPGASGDGPAGVTVDGMPLDHGPDLDAPAPVDPAPQAAPGAGDQTEAEEAMHLPPEIRLGHDLTRAMAHLPPQRASAEVATHLRKFWEPRMRQALVARYRAGDERLEPLLTAAVEDYVQDEIDPAEMAKPSGG